MLIKNRNELIKKSYNKPQQQRILILDALLKNSRDFNSVMSFIAISNLDLVCEHGFLDDSSKEYINNTEDKKLISLMCFNNHRKDLNGRFYEVELTYIGLRADFEAIKKETNHLRQRKNIRKILLNGRRNLNSVFDNVYAENLDMLCFYTKLNGKNILKISNLNDKELNHLVNKNSSLNIRKNLEKELEEIKILC